MAEVVGQMRRGGRTEKNRKAVANAVLQLLQEGRINFELQEVALLSGVHRTTLYRRWPERADLIEEALTEHVSRMAVEFSGDWEADLRQIAYAMRDWLSDPIEQAINRILITTDDESLYAEMARYWPPMLKRFQEPLQAAQARGELDPSIDTEIIISALISTLLTNILFLRQTISNKFIDRLVGQLLRGVPMENQKKVQSGRVKPASKSLAKTAPS